MTKRHERLTLGFLVFSIAISGCEEVPQSPRVASTAPIAENAVTSSERSGSDWSEANGVFDVTAPFDLEVLSQVDRDLVRTNLEKLTFSERTEPYRPAGMEDDVYYAFSRFTEPYFDTKPFLTIPFQATTDGLFSVSPEGNLLAVIGKQLEVWDLNAAKLLTTSALPSNRCTRLIWDINPESVLLMDNEAVYRVASATGEILNTWKPPQPDQPVFVVRAANSGKCVVSTKGLKMFAFGDDFQTTHEFKGPALDMPQISIRPDATWVLGIANGKLIRWHISPVREEMETLGELDGDENLKFVIAGSFHDYMVKPQVFTYCLTDRETQELKLTECESNPLVHTGGMGTVDGTQEWITCCSSRPDQIGTRQYFIQDLRLDGGIFSVEFPIGPEPVLEMSMDKRTEVCAIRDARQLRLYRRQRWKDFSGTWTHERLTYMAIDGRFEQVELAANELRKQPRLRCDFGEKFYTVLASYIGSSWANFEVENSAYPSANQISKKSNTSKVAPDDKTKAILKSFEEWKESGSELAALASGLRQVAVSQRARGSGWASDVTRSGWDEYELRNKRILSDIQPLEKLAVPSLAMLKLEITSALNTGKSLEDVQTAIKQLIELYPLADDGHVEVCIHLLPRWGGNAGDGGAYLAAVADLMPEPYKDLFYARVAIAFGEIYQPSIFTPQESGISISRMLQSVEEFLDRNDLWQDEVEFLLEIAHTAGRVDLVDKLALYHVRHYALDRFSPGDIEKTLIDKARALMAK